MEQPHTSGSKSTPKRDGWSSMERQASPPIASQTLRETGGFACNTRMRPQETTGTCQTKEAASRTWGSLNSVPIYNSDPRALLPALLLICTRWIATRRKKNGVLSHVSEKGQHGSNLQGRRGGFGSVKLTNKRYTNNLCATKPNACSLAKPGRTFPTATCGNQLRAPLAEAHHAGRSRPYDPAFAIADPCISAQRP